MDILINKHIGNILSYDKSLLNEIIILFYFLDKILMIDFMLRNKK